MATGLGIDVGSEFVKVVKASVSGGRVTILAAAKIPRKTAGAPEDAAAKEGKEKGLVLPPDLAARLKAAGVSGTGTAGITGRDINLKYVFIPPVPPEKLRMLMAMELGGKIGTGKISIQEGPPVTYDWRILNTPATLNSDLTIMAGSVRTDQLQAHMNAIGSVGLNVEAVTPSAFGLVQAYLNTQPATPDETVVLCDVGHEWLEIAIVKEKSVYFARCGPGGGKKINLALDKVLQTGPDRAAIFKHERARIYPDGATIANKQDEAFQPALREGADAIASGIRAALMFCRTQAKLPKLDFQRVLISGGGARLKGLCDYLEKKLARPVQPLNLAANVNLSKLRPDAAQLFDTSITDMAVAVGLACIDADPKCFHFRYIPESVLATRVFWRKTVLGIVAGVLFLLSLIFPYLWSKKSADESAATVAVFDELEQKAIQERKAFRKVIEEKKVLAATIDYHAKQTRSGRVYVELLRAIRAATPPHVILSFVGPDTKEEAVGNQPNAGVGLGNWAFADEPVHEIVISGEYEKEAYPEVPVQTINKAWLEMRAKILQVPGVKSAEWTPKDLDPTARELYAKRGKLPFQALLKIQDFSKPLKVVGEAEAAPEPVPAAKKDAKPQK